MCFTSQSMVCNNSIRVRAVSGSFSISKTRVNCFVIVEVKDRLGISAAVEIAR